MGVRKLSSWGNPVLDLYFYRMGIEPQEAMFAKALFMLRPY